MVFIDTHAHLFLEEFDNDRNEIIEKSIKSGVQKIVVPNVDVATLHPILNTCSIAPQNLFPAIGLHPCSVKANFRDELSVLREAIIQEKIKAIGEVGIDLYWDKTYYPEQVIALEEQIKWALENNLPIILHCRESLEQVYEIVKKYKNLKGVFHAFMGTVEQAKKITGLGFYLGIGGVVTFKNSGLDKIVEQISIENILLETDSPYLTPAPHRGKRNEPAYLGIVARKLAEIFQLPLEEIAFITTANAEKLFKI
jgi:TatD DNase family protein